MLVIVLIVVAFLLAVYPLFRCAVSHPHFLSYYGVLDVWAWFRQKRFNLCRSGEMVAYVGLFGKGKTLSAVRKVVGLYRAYNDKPVWCTRRKKWVVQKVKVISNVELFIPYEKFVGLRQIVRCAEVNAAEDEKQGTLTVTVVLGDEFSVQLNSRKFRENIDPLFLNTLLTCRHYHMSMYYTAQRFNQVDALLRQVTSYVVSCEKVWRFQIQKRYSAWEMENAVNPMMIKPMAVGCWFVRDGDYAAYDTLATVANLEKAVVDGEMMTAEEIIALQCNQPANMGAVERPSRSWLRMQRKKAG